LDSDFRKLSTDYETLRSDISSLREGLDDRISNNPELRKIVTEVSNLQANFNNLVANSNCVKELAQVNQLLRDKIEEQEAYSRKTNLEITGVPSSENENIKEIVIRLFSVLGITVKKSDILAAHRFRSFKTETTKPILVKLLTYEMKNDILRAARALKCLDTTILCPGLTKKPIYVNENLTPYRKKLLGMARQQLLPYVRGVWSDAGRVYVAEYLDVSRTNSNRVMIHNENQLSNIRARVLAMFHKSNNMEGISARINNSDGTSEPDH